MYRVSFCLSMSLLFSTAAGCGNPNAQTDDQGLRAHVSGVVASTANSAQDVERDQVQEIAQVRITINGFTCNHETWDDASQGDGQRDEVFFVCPVQVLDKDGKVVASSSAQSKVHGDTWRQEGRIQAGSSHDRGGIRNGDSFPTATPWIRQEGAQPLADGAPLLVYEGPLANDGTELLVTPTIWEWDSNSGPILEIVNEALTVANTIVGGGQIPASDEASGFMIGLGILFTAQESGAFGEAKTRPIGMTRSNGDKGILESNPQSFRLNLETLKQLTERNFGKGLGVVELHFRDDEKLKGDYSIYVQFEILPSKSGK
jgi:hypothetical protein